MLEWLAESRLLQAGGWVLVAIVAVSLTMWVLIIERYWFLRASRPSLVRALESRWREERCRRPLYDRRLRATLLTLFRAELLRGVRVIQVITAVLPMLGLLGTVIGMITIFEVLTVFGTGNVRGMAGGISQALVTTMAGLLTALSGMYFAHDLERRANAETDRLARVFT
jgi:biopolymer transport protein ExbB